MSDARQPPGWYGKLPGTGDFASRRLSPEVMRWWANWLQRSLQSQNERSAGWQQRYVRAPLWNFIIPGSSELPGLQLGCIAPSCDRVGRYYPLCLLLPIDTTSILEPKALRSATQDLTYLGYRVLEGIRRSFSPETLDQVLLEPCPLGPLPYPPFWLELALHAYSAETSSYWWTNPASGGPMRRHVHHGPLNNQLFNHLFDGRYGES